MNGLSSLMRLLDKDQNKLFFLLSFFKDANILLAQSFVASSILMFIKHGNCEYISFLIKKTTTPFKLELLILFPPSASFQLHVACCLLNGRWHMWPKCKSDSEFPFKWAPHGICTRPPLWPCGPFFHLLREEERNEGRQRSRWRNEELSVPHLWLKYYLDAFGRNLRTRSCPVFSTLLRPWYSDRPGSWDSRVTKAEWLIKNLICERRPWSGATLAVNH